MNTVMARRNTKLCEMSHRIHLSLTASKSISTTDTQMKAVRNSSNRMIVRGNITAWSPPMSSSSTNEHAKELLNPTSVSLWYWNQSDNGKIHYIKKIQFPKRLVSNPQAYHNILNRLIKYNISLNVGTELKLDDYVKPSCHICN